MATLTVYPRRYTSRKASGDHYMSHGDGDVVMLFEDLTNHRVNSSTWGFRKRAIDTAIRLFGNFDRWLKDQQENPDVSGYNVLFIDDIMTYVSTGRRQMAPLTWLGLLSEGNANGNKPSVRFELKDEVSRNKSTVEVIQKWCSHPHGAEDLVETLYVLFGSSHHNPSK